MPRRDPAFVDLALQGGGSHGAFTWGVVDRLLEEPWLEVEGISGTSAGAMNAAVLASGYAIGGRQGAREALAAFWRRVSRSATFSPFQRGPVDVMLGRWTLDNSPAFLMMDLLARILSPYDLPSVAGNPLAEVLRESVDFAALRGGPIKVFVTATSVSTGRPRIFRNADLGIEALLASACLPQLFQAVEIEGEPYWDGGFAGNPTLMPLVTELASDDTILIPINPIERPGTPRSARDILDRVNEISFNAVALKELKMMALLRKVADPGNSEGAAWARMRLHMVRNEVMAALGYSSKLNAEWAFLEWLREAGRRAAEDFLRDHARALGVRSSLDLDAMLAGV
ncbi:patatin-like phospholipase family protein [Roseomonas frigidaquae]|uniref:Patatin-like phospholipase family protein n=1 Tax=Falsiroseomonas frigidaquae TaxID=487318 RepID=A0ABX1EV83_9PROT|nr:patatin-like phospholipase family protein [Falsiroseomonas frigidaquae]NKE44007.1 patatin-like phospholipase family protein [Falsiroseomonas frigidaquae]